MSTHTTIRTALCAMALLVGSGAHATVCRFDTACRDAAPRGPSALDLVLTEGDRPGEVQMVSAGATVVMRSGATDEGGFLIGFSQDAVHMLTSDDGTIARYTRHLFKGPVAETFLGACVWDE